MIKNKITRGQLLFLIGWGILLSTPLVFATESHVLRTQGLINPGGNFKSGYLFINEMKIYIHKTTRLMNHREIDIPINEFQPKRWVYMEIEKDQNGKIIVAKKIFLLPHYVNSQEKRKFPFMK